MVTSSFPVSRDGSEAAGSFVADLADELSKSVDVRVVAPGRQVLKERWSARVEVFRYAAPAHPLSTLRFWRPGDLYWMVRVVRGGMAATRAASDGARHILAFWGLPCGEWARRAARRNSVGYSVWLLGSDVWSLGRVPLLRTMLARVIRHASKAYADGYRLGEDAQRIAGIPIEFLPSTRRIDSINQTPPRAKPPYRLLFLGRWHPNKGIDLLLDALALLGDEDWRRIECVEIQGGGPLEEVVRRRVAALRDSGRPVEAGRFLSKPEAETAIARADWVLIPSRVESIPVVFSDAVKLGRPTAVTPVGDLPRLLQTYRCGVLAQRADGPAIAEMIRSVLLASAADYGHELQAVASSFALEGVAGRLRQDLLHA